MSYQIVVTTTVEGAESKHTNFPASRHLSEVKKNLVKLAREAFAEELKDHAALSMIKNRRLPILPAGTITKPENFGKQFLCGFALQIGSGNGDSRVDSIELLELCKAKGWFCTYDVPVVRQLFSIIKLAKPSDHITLQHGTPITVGPVVIATPAPAVTAPSDAAAVVTAVTAASLEHPPIAPSIAKLPPSANVVAPAASASGQLPANVIAQLEAYLGRRSKSLSDSCTADAVEPATTAALPPVITSTELATATLPPVLASDEPASAALPPVITSVDQASAALPPVITSPAPTVTAAIVVIEDNIHTIVLSNDNEFHKTKTD